MSTAENGPTADTTMWTSLLHAGLAGSFLQASPHPARRRGAHRAWRSGRHLRHPLGLDLDQPHGRQLRPARHPRDLEPVPDLQRHLGLRPRRGPQSGRLRGLRRRPGERRETFAARRARTSARSSRPERCPPRSAATTRSRSPRSGRCRKQVEQPRPRAHRHPPRHRAGRGWRGAQPLLPDHPRGGRGLRPGEDGAARDQRLDEPAHGAELLPRARHHRRLARGHLGAGVAAAVEHGARGGGRRARTGSTSASTWTRSTPRYAPGTCVPTPGGLTSRELLELVRGVSRHGLVGVDVVETAPSLDSSSARLRSPAAW